MKVLALESANEQCSVSIVDENQELFSNWIRAQKHKRKRFSQ
jgi:tRNA A37 threonylcarbamoyltransferase TsaD